MQIPTYALYGEFLEQVSPDYLHYETIKERSQKHDWSIKPHRHRNLVQMFLFNTPDVVVHMGTSQSRTAGPAALFVPAMLGHGFQFEQTVSGGLISVPLRCFDTLLDGINADPDRFYGPIMVTNDHGSFQPINRLFREIEREFEGIRHLRNEALAALTKSLVINFLRARPSKQTSARAPLISRHEEQVRQFCSLVENHFRTDMRLEEYAARIGISKVQLTRNCDRILGTSPNQVIVNRRLVEAKRQLAYTQFSISEISYKLGFKDVGYFSRFFKRMSGQTPSDYRMEARQSP